MKHLGFKRYFTRPCEIYSHRSSLGKILKQLKGKEQFVISGNPKRTSKYFHIQYFILNRLKTLKDLKIILGCGELFSPGKRGEKILED